MCSAVPTPAVPKVRAEVHLGGNTRQLGPLASSGQEESTAIKPKRFILNYTKPLVRLVDSLFA
jgi:hypothetical protein